MVRTDHLVLVAAGGAIGACARHLVGVAALRLAGSGFPWGTLCVNVVGSLMMGLLIGWLALRGGADQMAMRLFVATGVLGGFTTFSAFSLDVVTLFERKSYLAAGGYLMSSVCLSVLALFAGLAIARTLAP